MSGDHYRTIAGPVEFRHKIERSEFLGIAFPTASEEAFFAELQKIQKTHHDATHHCWAFRLREGQEARARSSDAGEPSGTAGKPIQSALDGADYYDTAVVVVRWYGGIKLGTGGLGRAYRDTAVKAVALAKPIDRYEYARVEVIAPFDAFGAVYRLVDPPHVLLVEEQFGEVSRFAFNVRRSRIDEFRRLLTERRLEFRLTPSPGF